MSGLPNGDALLAALVSKSDGLRLALVAKVEANLSGDVLQVRSGALRASIVASLESGASTVSAVIESTGVPYAGIQEYGGRTGAHDIVATKAKALRYMGSSGAVFAKSVHHPGSTIPARSYLRSALDDMRAEIAGRLKASVLETLNAK